MRVPSRRPRWAASNSWPTLQPIEVAAGSVPGTRCIGAPVSCARCCAVGSRPPGRAAAGCCCAARAGVGKSCLSETLRRHIASRGGLTLCALFPGIRKTTHCRRYCPCCASMCWPASSRWRRCPPHPGIVADAYCDVDRVMPIFAPGWLCRLPPGCRCGVARAAKSSC